MKNLHMWSTALTAIILFLGVATPTRADEGPQAIPGDGTTIEGYLWNDANCDGIRQNNEGPMTDNPAGGQTMSLFYVGNDGIPFTADDSEITQGGPLNGNLKYSFSNGGGGYTYYIAIRPRYQPANYTPSKWKQGSDPSIDNNLKLWPDGAWATDTVVIPQSTGFPGGPPAITGVDIGLCPVAALPRPYKANLPLVQH